MNSEYCDTPEDWPADPPGLRMLDRSLRCGICQDMYTGPVVLVCGHSYCSRCIRDSLNVRLRDGQPQACPSCRVPCDQADLRPANHLREASQAWQAVRQLLLKHHTCMLQQSQLQLQQQQQQQLQQQQATCVQSILPQQEQQQIQRRLLQHTAGRILQRHQRAPKPTTSDMECQQQEDTITISSNGEDSDGEGGCSVTSDAEEESRDPDWQDSDDGDHDKQHPDSKQKGKTLAGKRTLKGSHSSSSSSGGGPCGALSCSQPDTEAASGDDLEVQGCKRPRRSNASGKNQQQQDLHNPKQPGKQQQRQKAKQSCTEQQQQLPPGYVACPVCGLSVREAFINTHVDSCLTRAGSGQPAAATASKKQTPAPVPAIASLAAAADNMSSKGSSRAAPSAPAGSGQGSTAACRPRICRPLEPPPKLCFELMKDKVLKAKLTTLGLSCEGDKKACVERYTFFRSYVLALKDNGKDGISLAEAAADFTRQEKHKARAASRPQSLGALTAAVPSAAGSMHSSGAKQAGAYGAAAGHSMVEASDVGTFVNHSYVALIQETRARMALQKTQQQKAGGQQVGTVAVEQKVVLHNMQPEQQQKSSCLAGNVLQLAAAAVSGVDRQTSGHGSQVMHISSVDKQAASLHKN